MHRGSQKELPMRGVALLLGVLVASPAHGQVLPQVDHVVVIGVDGLSPRGVDQGPTPVLNELMRRGSTTFDARGVFPTSSSPNWGSMIMGAAPEQHGVTSNDWRAWNRAIEPSAEHDGIFPTMFSALRQQRPDARIAVIYDWGGIGTLFQKPAVDVDLDADGPEATMQAAVAEFREHRPDLLFVHLDHVDGAGHAHGWHTQPYFDAVERADRLIGHMVEAIEGEGLWDRTALIVTSDHGGIGTSHGGQTMDELLIPWIIAGGGVASGRSIDAPIYTYDTASTALALLGVEQPRSWIGKPVIEAAASFPLTPGRASELRYVPAPQITPPGGLQMGGEMRVTLASEAPEAFIHYTLDGSTPDARSPRYTGPIRLDGSATLVALAIENGRASRPVSASFRILPADAPRPVRYSYYEGAWSNLPNFASLVPTRTGVVPEIGLEFLGERAPAYAARLEAVVDIPAAGTWTFWLTSDDGSRLLVNGRRIIDNDGEHGPIEKQGSIDLRPGPARLTVEYFQAGGGAILELRYGGPDTPKQMIPAERLIESNNASPRG